LHGVLEAPQIAKRPDGKWDVIVGHRRIAALHILAKRGFPGFSVDMSLSCTEVLDSSRVALMARSMSTNELGLRLDPLERLMGVKLMDEEGASKKDIAVAAKVSEKSVTRDLLIVRHARVLQHVKDNHLPTTVAAALVDVAVAKKRL